MEQTQAEGRGGRGRHPSHKRGPTTAPVGAQARWQERRWLAALIRLAVFFFPIVLSFLLALALSSWLPTPDPFVLRLARWVMIAVASTGVLMLAQRLMRRALPLAALMSLTLVFPDETPSRFGLALRSMSARQLEKRLAEVDERGLGATPREAAETLLELVAALSRHDRLTRGHAERVRAYSVMIGEELEFSEAELDRLRWAALLHDIGKLHVAPEILNKPGALTSEEYEQVKRHTVAGQILVAPLSGWLGEAAGAVHQHHERYEGGGYPTGTPASELPLVSRIVSVADAFDVMTSARSYKVPISARAARAELERCAGSQFDPVVVRAMMNVSLGALWRAMGPMAWMAQVSFFPRPLSQGGTVASAVLAALLALLLTGLAEVSRLGGSELLLVEGSAIAVVEPGHGTGGGGGGGAAAGGGGEGGGRAGGGAADDFNGSESYPGGDHTTATTDDASTSTTEPSSGSLSPVQVVVTALPPPPAPTTAPATATTTTTAPVASTTTLPVAPPPPPTTTTTTTLPVAPPPPPATTTTTTSPVAPPPPPATTTTTTTTTTGTTETTTTTTTEVATTTTTLPPDPNRFVLASPGPGDQVALPLLQLDPDRPPQNDALPNYDTDRNGDPGLTLTPGPGSLNSSNPGTVQVWQFPSSFTMVEGNVALDLWAAPSESIGSGSSLRLAAGLFECVVDRSTCVQVKRDSVIVNAPAGEFVPMTLDLTPISLPHVPAVGSLLELRIAVDAGSSVAGWIAYDASGHESQLVVTPQAPAAPLEMFPLNGGGHRDAPAAIVVTLIALLMAHAVQRWRIEHGRIRQFALPAHG